MEDRDDVEAHRAPNGGQEVICKNIYINAPRVLETTLTESECRYRDCKSKANIWLRLPTGCPRRL